MIVLSCMMLYFGRPRLKKRGSGWAFGHVFAWQIAPESPAPSYSL